jgi:hypothetical protein
MGAWALFAQEQGLNNIQDREKFVDNPRLFAQRCTGPCGQKIKASY